MRREAATLVEVLRMMNVRSCAYCYAGAHRTVSEKEARRQMSGSATASLSGPLV
jgi:hypothetical protein